MKPMLERLVGESVELRMEAAAGGAPIEADRSQLEQVLLNLVVNARDAMPDGGTLTLAVAAGVRFATPGEAERLCVRIDVVDTGVAIDPKVLPHIFEPFFTTKHRSAGAGLGLATCYGIVAQAGGHTGVESERGKGTRFTIHWPEAAGSAGGARAFAAAATAAGRETVLLVEDEAAVRRISARALADRGYRVIAAADGAEALALGEREGPIDLLVTDVVMPHLGGRELAERLLVRNAALRVLFVSGYTPDDALNERIQTGAAAFLPKPYRPDDLLARVREVLDAPVGAERRA
jgi:CheY-like chemotaxis protein